MSLPAIEVSGLSKRYVIEHESRHDTLRDTLHHTARKLWRRFRWGTGFQREEFWALKDVSFTVQPGEVVGIIGRNGAGKSTLLKILSRITEPTAGKVTLRGRVASLLEVGTGFHPDLTGRENIYLNGAILGMRRAEIRRKFDEIVAFAEVEKFLDTPVKRYSSGMYVRLAFAVAAHLEPEILIVDEVLSVGDVAFQKKCIGKMQDVASNQGRTVLFVSHNISALLSLCQSGLLLQDGRLVAHGSIQRTTQQFLSSGENQSGHYERTPGASAKPFEIKAIQLLGADGHPTSNLENGSPFHIALEYHSQSSRLEGFIPSISVCNLLGIKLFHHHARLEKKMPLTPPGSGRIEFRMTKTPLPAGTYRLSAALVTIDGRVVDHLENVLEFTVVDGNFYAPGESTPASHGLVLVEGDWSITALPAP